MRKVIFMEVNIITRYKSIACALGIIALLIFSAGCGENILVGSQNVPATGDDISYVNALLDNASSPQDYGNAITKLDEIIANSEPGSSVWVQGYALKGEAQLGKLGITPLDVFSEIARVMDTHDSVNIFYAIPIADTISVADLSISADALNIANDGSLSPALTKTNRVQSTTTSTELTADEQLVRGIANMLVVVAIVKMVYIIDEDGNNEPKPEYQKPSEQLEFLMSPPPGVPHNVVYYMNKAMDGFTLAGAFTDDQMEIVNSVLTLMENLEILYDGYKNKTDVTIGNVTYEFATADDPEPLLEDAIQQLFHELIL